jgi:micrococcal nuclease
VLNRAVTTKVRALDRYGRRLGKLYDDTEDIGQRLVKDGHAWSLRYRWDRGPYMAEERMAKALSRGVHKAGDAEEPRAFRKRHGSCKAF